MAGDTIGIGEVIFTSFKPIIKMAAIAGGGALFAKKGLLTPEACKTNANIIMNFLLPMLIFSTVLPAFDSKNMASVLSVVITSLFYQALGLCFGLIVRWLAPIPASWKGGVLAAGAFSNVGDLVIAYISTIAKSAPFDPETDPARGIAYTSIFMVVQLVVIFNFGGYQLIKRDFDISRVSLTDIEKPPVAEPISQSPFTLTHSVRTITTTISQAITRKPQKCAQRIQSSYENSPPLDITITPALEITALHKETAPTIITATSTSTPAPSIAPTNTAPHPSKRLWAALQPFLTPPSLSLAISLVVANVPTLKALFIPTPGVAMPSAPDDKPPLDFIMELATFGGPAAPVVGMLLLGAALSRLSMHGLPKGFWKAAVMMAGLKLVVGPIIGIAWTTGLTRSTTWIPTTDKILQLVLIIGSAAPTATTQVFLTNIFAPLGPEGCVEMSALSAILLVQYALMVITLTIVVCYSLMVAI